MVKDIEDLYEEFCAQHLCDGLPIIPPTHKRVERMLTYTGGWTPDDIVIAPGIPSWAPITIEKLAINAVMAGCKPEYFPVIINQFMALSDKKYPGRKGWFVGGSRSKEIEERTGEKLLSEEGLMLGTSSFPTTCTTAYNGGWLTLLSGPIAEEIGVASGMGCCGPGWRANATIGRMPSLTSITVLGAHPEIANASTQGSPVKYTWCFAETRDPDRNPWDPLNVELYGDPDVTSITVAKGEPNNVTVSHSREAEEILKAICSAASHLGGNNVTFISGPLIVTLCPAHAQVLANSGFKKRDVKKYVYDNARFSIAQLIGKIQRRPWFSKERLPVVNDIDEILVVVAGAWGAQQEIVKPWGHENSFITQPLQLKDGTLAKSINDFK